MDLSTLWIGDNVQILSSGKKGRFEGISKDNRARISYQGKVLLVKSTNLIPYEEKERSTLLDDLESETAPRVDLAKSLKFERTLDLHIDVLNPSLVNAIPQHILNYQLARCSSYIEKAILCKVSSITIIHGRGTGRLKQEIIHLLKGFDKIGIIESTHNDGAVIASIRLF